MNRRIRDKKYNKQIRETERKAIKKLKERYNTYIVKKGPRKDDIIIRGLEQWKIQLEYWNGKSSIIMHPYSIIDSFKTGEAYISMCKIDSELFELLDDMIANEKYHLGCAWAGPSKSQEEGMEKYSKYINSYNEHMNETKEIKSYMENYLKELAKNEYIKEIAVFHPKGNLYEEGYGVFVFAKHDIPENIYNDLSEEISKAFKIKKYQLPNELRSKMLLPGRGIKYSFAGVFTGKDEREYKKRLGKDVYKTFTSV